MKFDTIGELLHEWPLNGYWIQIWSNCGIIMQNNTFVRYEEPTDFCSDLIKLAKFGLPWVNSENCPYLMDQIQEAKINEVDDEPQDDLFNLDPNQK